MPKDNSRAEELLAQLLPPADDNDDAKNPLPWGDLDGRRLWVTFDKESETPRGRNGKVVDPDKPRGCSRWPRRKPLVTTLA
ncbi:hypothetical protein [Reyranella soli]|uniref:hypothetical protein n=1 Tax=Reyranella soli TaxID=1230389 RepID=UPI0011BDF94A|nr:hypothetical protein [Reyranella soli]